MNEQSRSWTKSADEQRGSELLPHNALSNQHHDDVKQGRDREELNQLSFNHVVLSFAHIRCLL
jgi:hypothetical protein